MDEVKIVKFLKIHYPVFTFPFNWIHLNWSCILRFKIGFWSRSLCLEVTSTWHEKDHWTKKKKKNRKTWKTHRYFIGFECEIDIEFSTSHRYQYFDVDSSFIIGEILTNFWCWISMSNRWRFMEDVSIGRLLAP